MQMTLKNLKGLKQPTNPTERAFFCRAILAGWFATKKGWPNFFCVKDGRVALVEVKSRKTCRLSRYQRLVIKTLMIHGLDCYTWSPDAGFKKITRAYFDSDLPWQQKKYPRL